MRFILDILRGAIIGIANVIPGVSGGTMAVVMGVYDKILIAATNIVKDFKGSLKTLLPYGVGLLLGILGFAQILEFLFANFPVPTAFAFPNGSYEVYVCRYVPGTAEEFVAEEVRLLNECYNAAK